MSRPEVTETEAIGRLSTYAIGLMLLFNRWRNRESTEYRNTMRNMTTTSVRSAIFTVLVIDGHSMYLI